MPAGGPLLSTLANGRGVVLLAFHVDYWNHLGWPDRFAKPEYSRRQRDAVAKNGSRVVYTPQFLLDGRDWRRQGNGLPWRDRPARRAGRLTISLDTDDPGRLDVRGSWPDAGRVYLAVYENNLESDVRAGENSGRRLHHAFVVRALAGPMQGKEGRFAHRFTLDPAWKRRDLGVAAFVEAPDGHAVTQAVQRPLCASMH